MVVVARAVKGMITMATMVNIGLRTIIMISTTTKLLTSALTMTGIILTAGFAMFPFVMPSITEPGSSLTLYDAASSHLTLTVMFWAVVIFLPLILGYTVWTYRAMWGRVTVEQIREHTHSAY